jgi:hypothetical protein
LSCPCFGTFAAAIARGYRALAYVFLVVFVLPVLTLGLRLLWKGRSSSPILIGAFVLVFLIPANPRNVPSQQASEIPRVVN